MKGKLKDLVKLRKVALAIALLCALGHGRQFTDPGSCELGGTIGYTHLSVSGSSENLMQIAPVMNFFAARCFMLGPALSYTGMWDTYESTYDVGLGFNTGVVTPINNGTSFFYLTSGIQLVLEGYSVEPAYGSSSADHTGYSIPIQIGFKFPVQQHLSINFGPAITFMTINNQTETQISIAFGISGLVF